jgi:tRNA pseudouridine(55) synthase
MIFPIWQPLFSSSHQLAESIGSELGEKATHTGTLDPLAEGVLVILTGEDRLAKEALADWDKEYEFEILWGVATDSGDLLGMIQELRLGVNSSDISDLESALQSFVGEYEQALPDFSARRWKGKSAFDFAREGKEIPVKTRRVKVLEAEVLGKEKIGIEEFLALQQEKVAQVRGDFRQEEILSDWREKFADIASKEDNELIVSKLRVVCSSGFYVRQFIQDVAKKIGVPALAFSIVRTRNGSFEREEC